MKVITESEMNFGEFDESNLFHIENSKIYRNLGDGIKTVEFILKYKEDSIIFLEAKKSCPNAEKRHETEEKERKFEVWLVGPSAELKARLLQIRKIWNIEIMVLNEELAEKLSLTANNQDYAL